MSQTKEYTKEQMIEIPNIINWIVDSFEEEILECENRQDLVKKYFSFDYTKKYENSEKRLLDFFENLESIKWIAELREKNKIWFACCVDRVYQYYVHPAIKKFEETR